MSPLQSAKIVVIGKKVVFLHGPKEWEMRKVLLLLAILFSAMAHASGINIRLMQNVSVSLTDELRCIYFDREGLLWIGTSAGLKSYDGYQTRTYMSSAYTPGILPNNTVLCLTEDHEGHMWIGTRDGVARMDKRTGQFRTYHLPREKQRIIYMMYTGRDGTVWLGTDDGLSRYEKGKDAFVSYSAKNLKAVDLHGKPMDIGNMSVKSIVEDKHGNMFFGTWNGGLFRFLRSKNVVVRYPQRNHLNSAFSLYMDSKDRLWIGTWGHGMECMERPLDANDTGWRSFGRTAGSFNTYEKIVEDPVSGTLWACCREGVSIIDLNRIDAGFVNLRVLEDGRTESLSSSHDIVTDKNGNIWIGTMYSGVKHVCTRPSPFVFHGFAWESNVLPMSKVGSIFTADGTHFYVGLLPYGLAYYDKRTGQTYINKQIPGMEDIDERVFGSSFSSIQQRYNGDLWMASGSFGLVILPRNGRAKQYWHGMMPCIFDDYVNTLYAARDGRMWIGARSGLSVANVDGSGKWMMMQADGRDFSHCDVRGISEDHEGNIWVATENEGIIKVEPKAFRHYSSRNGKLAVNEVTRCFEDSHHRLWAISNSGGSFLYDAGVDRFMPVNRQYHIDGMKVYAINEDVHGHLWMTTENALVRLSFREGETQPEVSSFAQEEGVASLMFAPNSTFRYADELYFGARNGFHAFAPAVIQATAKVAPGLIVTDIYVDDRALNDLDSALQVKVSAATPLAARSIQIPPAVRKFGVEFALLTYSNQVNNHYAYRLEGYDDWHFCEVGMHQATFENIPPGKYKLHLKASDNYGRWISLPYTIEVRVLPHWYETWWAFLLYLLLIVGLLYVAFRWYQNHVKTQNRLQMMRVFTNITHELLTPLAVISASVDELRMQSPQHDKVYATMQNNISRLVRLLRQILEVRKSQAGQLKLKVSPGNLADFVNVECTNFELMAKSRGQRINTDIHEVEGWFDPDKLDKIIYNLLSNALKYNKEGGTVSVSLSEREGMALLVVADEGVGMSAETQRHLYSRFYDGDYRKMKTHGTGLGLSLTHELVVLHHGEIRCQSELGKGTTFTVKLPIGKEVYGEAEMEYAQGDMPRDMEAAEGIVPELPADDGTRKEYTVLIVEDNVELLGLMARLLGRRYNVRMAKNGKQAWDIVQKEDLDIVVSDVMMPVLDGIELTRTIKNSDDYGQLPVVLLTAKTRDEDRAAGYAIGADDYLPKPFRQSELELRIDNIIQNRERIRRRFASRTDYTPEEMHGSSPDELFLQKAIACVRQHLDEYDRETFARDMAMSSSMLYNRLRTLTGQNVSSFILSVRMKEACRIARQEPHIRVNELSMRVGISTPKYFTKCFKEAFGMLPSEYIEKLT